MTIREIIYQRLVNMREIGELNEANFSLIGEGWHDLESLVSIRPGVYATLAGWVCAVASEWFEVADGRFEDLEDEYQGAARSLLGLTESQWEQLEGKPIGKTFELLDQFIGQVVPA